MSNQTNKSNVFMSIKAFFLLITLFLGFFLVGCGGGSGGFSSGNVSNTTNAAVPKITVQPQNANYIKGNTANPLSVTTNVSDGGTLSYQWYKNSANSNNGGTPISGETSSSFTPPTSDIGTTYYYVVVTNTNNNVNGIKTANITSDTARIAVDVIIITDAQIPTITVQPISATYTQGDIAIALNITATVNDGGVLSYQWYSNTINSNNGGTPISGATNSSYTPPTSDIGTTYYYVVVTNTNDGVNGVKTANVTSTTAQITVDALIITNAATPTITVQPANATYTQGDTANPLSVTASVNDGGILEFQWYKNSINSNNGGTPISGATNSSYTPPTSDIGTTYYYVVVTNTNNNVNGNKTANVASDTARIAIGYLVSFYDENLDHVVTINAATSIINLSSISNTSNPWYKANSTLPLRADYTLTNDVRFYAVPNVQEISNQTHLNNIRNNPNGKYILLNSIDLNETGAGFDSEGWIPIGDDFNIFTGIFNGDFNNITNLWANKTTYYIGFFGYIENATIRNLNIKAAEDKEIKGTGSLGGIAGVILYSNITNSCFTGNISGDDNGGGITGHAGYSSITNSCFAGNISSNDSVGGIVGYAVESGITSSYSTGNISGDVSIGGIVGHAQNSNTTNSYSTGNISGNVSIGGIVGHAQDSSIANSYSIGSVNGNQYIGGIVGLTRDAVTIKNNAAINPSVTGEMDVNRVVGIKSYFSIGFKSSNNFALDTMVGGVKYNGMTNSFSNSSDVRYHGTDKTQIELKTQATYFDAVNGDGLGGLGFKFGDDDDNPWKIDPNKNNGYPYLYWQDMR